VRTGGLEASPNKLRRRRTKRERKLRWYSLAAGGPGLQILWF
jgi:hypothetical protein